MLDVLIKNAKVIDGSGAPAYSGSVGIENGKIEPDILHDCLFPGHIRVIRTFHSVRYVRKRIVVEHDIPVGRDVYAIDSRTEIVPSGFSVTGTQFQQVKPSDIFHKRFTGDFPCKGYGREPGIFLLREKFVGPVSAYSS